MRWLALFALLVTPAVAQERVRRPVEIAPPVIEAPDPSRRRGTAVTPTDESGVMGPTTAGNGWLKNLQLQSNGPLPDMPNTWRAPMRTAGINNVASPVFGFHDVSAFVGQCWVVILKGRCSGGVFESIMSEGTDGLMVGVEAGLVNFGAETTDPDAWNAKVNYWGGVHRDGYATAATSAGKRGTAFISMAKSWASGGQVFKGVILRDVAHWYLDLSHPAEPNAIGILFWPHANWGEAMRVPNGSGVNSWCADGVNTCGMFYVPKQDALTIGRGVKSINLFIDGQERPVEMGPPDAQGYRTLRVRG
jgi:hypothetical protein